MGLTKVRHQGLAKIATSALALLGLANINMAHKHLIGWVRLRSTGKRSVGPDTLHHATAGNPGLFSVASARCAAGPSCGDADGYRQSSLTQNSSVSISACVAAL